MKKVLILLLILWSASAGAQDGSSKPKIIYSHEMYGGLTFCTNGYGAFFNYGKHKGAYNLRQFNVDFLFVKHEKEIKMPNQNDPNARSYFYGKQNNFYVIRPAYGHKHIMTEKSRKNGVQVSYNWQFGPDLGFTKPVYLEIAYQVPNSPNKYYLQTEKFDSDKHFFDNIYGRASGFLGFRELKFHPGAFFKFAFSFEYNSYRDRLTSLEVGASADVYARRIPIMAEKILSEDVSNPQNHRVFLALYLNFYFGAKYNFK